MREEKIENMDFKALRKEVLYLRDELAVFKRKFEDAIYNLDSDNFGKSFTFEQNGMKAQIKLTAEGLKSAVSKSELGKTLESYSTLEQTAEAIRTTVSQTYVTDLFGDDIVTNTVLESKIEQSAGEIRLSVSKTLEGYVTNTVLESKIEQSAGEIRLSVSKTLEGYVTNTVLESKIEQSAGEIRLSVSKTLEGYATNTVLESKIMQSADGIRTSVSETLNGYVTKESIFTQKASGFTLDGALIALKGIIYLTDSADSPRFVIDARGYENGENVTRLYDCAASPNPIIIGDSDDAAAGGVYIGSNLSDGNRIATRSWVENNVSAVAVFG